MFFIKSGAFKSLKKFMSFFFKIHFFCIFLVYNNFMEKKKILFIITKSVWGGAQKYVYDLAVNLPKEEFEVSVASGGQYKLAEGIKKARIDYYEIKNFKRDISFISDIFSVFEVLKLLRDLKPDIVHVNSSKAGGIAGLAVLIYKVFLKSKILNLKSVFTAHGWAFNEARPKWQIFLIKFASRLTCVFYDKIICVSEFDRQAAIKNKIAPERKLITIHNGIDINESVFLSREEARKNLKSQISNLKTTSQNLNLEGSFWIGTVGEFTKNKGQNNLIDAAKILNSGLLTFDFRLLTILIGWGEKISNLKPQISNLQLENHVFLIEGLSPAAPYLKAFDIFVLPSLKEGLPYTLLEAGLAGLPVIASNVGGIPEIIENNKTGLLASAANIYEIARAIKKLIEDKNLSENLAKNLRQKIISEFSFKKTIKKTLNVYS